MKAQTRDALAALYDDELSRMARGLEEAVNGKLLFDTRYLEDLLALLMERGLDGAGLQLLGAIHVAWRKSLPLGMIGLAMELALRGDAKDVARVLDVYERHMRRDPSDLYLLGPVHARVVELAERLGDRERAYALLEVMLDYYTPPPGERSLPDNFPVNDPRIEPLWARPAQATLLRAVEAARARLDAQAKKRAKNKRPTSKR